MDTKEKWNALADSFQKTVAIQADYNTELFDHMRRKDALVPGEWVADIGCGAGKNALGFVKEGMKVILIDISDRMLDYSRANLGEKALDCEFFEGAFEETDIEAMGWKGRVHLSFASMTPAVSGREGIERMCLMSSSQCLITTFADRRDCLAEEVSALTGIEFPGEGKRDAHLNTVETVRSLGYDPEVTLVEYNWENLLSPDEAEERFFSGRVTELPDDGEHRELIRDAVKKLIRDDGRVSQKEMTHAAWIWWKV